MVVVYATLIINGRRTFESVPAKLKEAVKAELESLGLNQDGEERVHFLEGSNLWS